MQRLLLVSLVAPGCATATPPATVPGPVDLERYAGRWLELARLPAFFQRGCVRSTAEYAPIPGGVSVVNRCFTAEGEERRAEGSASAVPGSGNTRLRVRFDGFWARLAPVPAEGNYWILALSPDYRSAVVGTRDRRYLWILAREPVSHSEEDRRFEEIVSVRNQADGLIHAARKTVKDAGDKATQSDKYKIEAAAKALEEVMKGDDKAAIEAKIEALSEASAGLAQKLYAEQAQPGSDGASGGGAAGAGGQSGDQGAVDAVFEEVKDDDRK